MVGGGAIENSILNISGKIGEAYDWLKNKLISLFKLFSESIAEALLGLKSFITSCCEKLREVLSWINTQLDNILFGNINKVVPEREIGVVPEKASLPAEMKMLIQKMRSSLNQWVGTGNSLEMKATHLAWNGFLDIFEGFMELLESAYEKPWLLIPPILDGFFIYRSRMKTGRVSRAAGNKGKASMAIATLISLILPSTVLF